MPDGIQVGDTATNPQTGNKIRWNGQSWEPVTTLRAAPNPSLWQQISAPFRETGAPYWNATVGSLPFVGNKLSVDERPAPNTFVRNIEDLTQTGRAEHPVEAWFGDKLRRAGELTRAIAPEVAALGVTGAGGPVVAERTGARVSEGTQRAAQNLFIGQSEIERVAAEHEKELADLEKAYQEKVNEVGRKTAEDEAAYKTKVEQAKDSYARKVAENQAKRIEVSAKETAADTKKSTFQQPRSGPVYQRLKGMADQVGESVSSLDKTIRAAYKARYNAFRQAMGDAEGNLEPVQQAVVDAQDTILKGSPENIAVFRNLLKEGEDPLLSQASVFKGASRGIDVKEVLSSLKSEGERNRFLKGLQSQDIPIEGPEPGPKAGATIPIEELQGYSTELGDKLYGGSSLSGDVRRALKYVKDAADKEIMRVADTRGQGAIKRQLDRDWAQYMGDFYDSDGALYRFKNAINSDSRIANLSGGEGSRVVEAMGHYARFNPDIGMVGRVRSLVKQLRELPSSSPREVGDVSRPRFPGPPSPRTLPKPPVREPFSASAYRRQHLEKIAENLRRITGWDVASIGYVLRELSEGETPWAISYSVGKRLLAKMLSNPKVIEYLSKELPNVARK